MQKNMEEYKLQLEHAIRGSLVVLNGFFNVRLMQTTTTLLQPDITCI